MIGNSISLDGSSETSSESAHAINYKCGSDLFTAGLRPNPAGINWLRSQNSEGNDSTLESQRQLHELNESHN